MEQTQNPQQRARAFLASLNPSPQARRYLYRLGLAIVALLTFYGVIANDAVAIWTVVLGALLGLADLNVPRDPTAPEAREPAPAPLPEVDKIPVQSLVPRFLVTPEAEKPTT